MKEGFRPLFLSLNPSNVGKFTPSVSQKEGSVLDIGVRPVHKPKLHGQA